MLFFRFKSIYILRSCSSNEISFGVKKTCKISTNDSCLFAFEFCAFWVMLVESNKGFTDESLIYRASMGSLLYHSIILYLSQFFPHSLCQSSSGLMGVADRWQSHFHSGVVSCYLGAKPCNSYKCHIKSQPGRREWQSDGEASHNHHYQCLYGWHPQIEMCRQ